MPKIAAECLAKWVICQDISQEELEASKKTVWDRQAKMQKYHSMWKGRQVIEGAPTHSQDVSREIEILSLTEEKEGEAIILKTNRRPFAVLVDTKMLQHVQIRK